jgi:hypothetical protein
MRSIAILLEGKMSAEAVRAEAVLRNAAGPADQSATVGSAANVDRIREILFGTQMREYEQHFVRIEERLSRETADLKTEVRRRLDSLEDYIRQEVDCLADRLKAERNERTESADRISHDIADSLRTLENRLVKLDDQISKDFRELRQSVVDRQSRLSDELTQSIGAASMLQSRRLEDLRATTIDRFAFSNLLTELGLRIRGEQCMPGVEDSTDAGADQ